MRVPTSICQAGRRFTTELKDKNFEIVAAAQDIGGEAAAGKWYDAAKATFTTLVDTQHAVSSAFQLVNVPTGVWIDERGRVVRPAEPAWTSTRTDTYGGKALEIEGELYVGALRDWVTNGDKQSVRAVRRRVRAARQAAIGRRTWKPRPAFKLAVWFQQDGRDDLAAKYFERAQTLNPDDWNYHRQEWSFTPQEAGRKWLEKFLQQPERYYPKLELKPKGG